MTLYLMYRSPHLNSKLPLLRRWCFYQRNINNEIRYQTHQRLQNVKQTKISSREKRFKPFYIISFFMCMPNKCVRIFKRQKCMHFVRMQKSVYLWMCRCICLCEITNISRAPHEQECCSIEMLMLGMWVTLLLQSECRCMKCRIKS